MSYRPPVTKEESFGNVTLQLLGGEAPVFSSPREFLDDIGSYEKVKRWRSFCCSTGLTG